MRNAVQMLGRSSITLAALALVAGAAQAQTWPTDDEWIVLRRDGVAIEDPLGDRQAYRDIVGDADSPAAFVAADADHLYFRLRIDADPFQSASNYRPFGWGVEIDTDAVLSSYELLAIIDGIVSPEEVSLRENTSPAAQLDARDPAETVLTSYPTPTHTRVVTATSTFNDDPDYFVDWAIAIADLVAAGVDLSQPIRFVVGTSNDTKTLASDLASTTSADVLEMLWSDPLRCDAGSCDYCAALCGAGCLRCEDPTAACDGMQCVECTSGDDCPSIRPLCDRATSTCVGGAPCANDGDCDDPRFPACQPDGSCGECSRTNDLLCDGATLLCDVSAGECTAQCTSDADCTGPGRPACALDGRCAECSEGNASACDPSLEACNPGAGACAERCGGDVVCEATSRPICKDDTVCVECLRDDNCPSGAPVCDSVTGNCIRATDVPSSEDDAGAPADGGLADAGGAPAGADAAPSGPTGRGASFAGGGCGCRLAGAPTAQPWPGAVLLGFFAFAWLVRRRHGTNHQTPRGHST